MSVSRQTVSKWEADEIVPELDKIIQLSDIFSCRMDVLVRENLMDCDAFYSEITVKNVKGFRMARYVMVTPNPENDVNRYMDAWATKSGLLAVHPNAKRIGWDFPYVSLELQNRFALRGYVAAYVLPDDFVTDCPGVEYANQNEADYAVITIYDPFAEYERIRKAYQKIFDHLQANGFKEKPKEDVLTCFEYVYEEDNRTCMDVYIHVDSVTNTTAFTNFS